MEVWQKKIIVNYMDKLINLTNCNDTLLAKLRADKVLSENDVEDLKSQSSPAKVHSFYKIMMTRNDGFHKMVEALQETNQSGAVEILVTEEKKHENNGLDDDSRISYEKDQVLGEGSSGTIVYKGKFGNRDVAVKRINADQEKGKTIVQEIENLKIGDVHENIVRLFCTKVVMHFVLIVLELCDMTLKDWVNNKASIDLTPVQVIKQITVGLGWLHAKWIVHRDLKPENILLVAQVNKVKISDFGLSRKIRENRQYVSSVNAGTQGWVAPEALQQFEQGETGKIKFTFESDMFALGCVYYYVLTDGKHAFGGPVSRDANILYGKIMIDTKDVLHCCSQNLMFIRLMISKDPSCRPNCSALLKCPIFWSPNHNVKFLEDVKTHGQGIIRQLLLKFKWNEACQSDHKAEMNVLHAVKQRAESSFRCVVPFAYLQCQAIKDQLGEHYAQSSTFNIGEVTAFAGSGTQKIEGDKYRPHSKETQKPKFEKNMSVDQDSSGQVVRLHQNDDGARRKLRHQSTSLNEPHYKSDMAEDKLKERYIKSTTLSGSPVWSDLAHRRKHSLNDILDTDQKITRINEDLEKMDLKRYTTRLFDVLRTEDLSTIQGVFQTVPKINEIYDYKLKSLLHVAVETRDFEIVEYLLEEKEFLKMLSKPRFKNSLLHACIKQIHELPEDEFEDKCKMIKLILQIKPELVNSRDEQANTPLHIATGRDFENGKQVEYIKMLLDYNADVNAKNNKGNTPLQLSVKHEPLPENLMEIITFLIENNADPDCVDSDGNTFLHLAAYYVPPQLYHALAQYLLSIGRTRSFTILNTKNSTILHYAVYYLEPLYETLEIFKSNGVNFNAVKENGETLLFSAIKGGRNDSFLKTLIRFGADWKALNHNESTVLHYAASWTNQSALKLFISLGCDVNATNALGNTPLHEVFLENDGKKAHQVASELVKHRADVTVRNNNGDLPIDLARKLVTYWRLEERTVELLENASRSISGWVEDEVFV